MHTANYMKQSILIAVLALSSCTSYSDLGDDFKLYEYDSADIYVGYCFNDCDKSSIMVVPPTVEAISYDDRWIVARTRSAEEPGYWLVDKRVTAEFCYDCGFSDSVRANVRGPLSADEFQAALSEENITLSLDS